MKIEPLITGLGIVFLAASVTAIAVEDKDRVNIPPICYSIEELQAIEVAQQDIQVHAENEHNLRMHLVKEDADLKKCIRHAAKHRIPAMTCLGDTAY